jgi:hypothetical protein
MPEQLTRHPEITLRVLESAGAECGQGAPQKILKQCPAERFCRLPRGEMCIFGLEDAPQMTQISMTEWRTLLPEVACESPAWYEGGALLGGGVGLLAGLLVGAVAARRVQIRG